MNKKDFKYIIKRILIGVGIVFCVGFLNKCSVKAESNYQLYLNVKNYDLPNLSTTKYNDITNIDYSFDIGSYTINLNDVVSSNNTSDLNYYSLVFKTNDEDYLILTNSGIRNIPNIGLSNDIFDYIIFDEVAVNYINKSNNDEIINFDDYRGYWNLYLLSQNSSLISTLDSYITNNFSLNNYSTQTYIENNLPGILNYVYGISSPITGDLGIYDLIGYLYENYHLVHTSLDMELDDTILVPDENPIPSYYTQLDMQQHAGVYFVPKDYSTLQTVLNSQGQRVYVFNYYYQGKFSEGYFPLSDYGKIVFFYYEWTSRDNKSFNSSWFPFSVTEDSTTYDYFAFIIENDDFGSLNQHLPSYIWYDSRYFDYYFIDDFFDYNENISYIDKSGNTISSDVSITDSLRSLYKQGFQNRQTAESIAESMIHSLDNNVLGQYLNFITIPFSFLWSFTSSTCESITLPIPFVNSEISLSCLSSVFEEHVPALKNIIFIVINGILVFRITMRNIDTVTDVLKADDDKIEVVDL